jgi:hypothetical protein
LEASSPYVVSDSGGEEPKRKNKPPADVYEPSVKGKKRVSIIFFTASAPAADFTTQPIEGKPKPNPKKQKLSPTKGSLAFIYCIACQLTEP